MATNKDYIQRMEKAGKQNRTRPDKSNLPSNFPIKRIIFAASLVTIFSVSLLYLSTKNPDDKNAQTEASQISNEATNSNSSQIKQAEPDLQVSIQNPPVDNNAMQMPEEKWSYIETLENKEVQVVLKEQQLSERPYVMQCGAYRNPSQAEQRKGMIAFNGLVSEIKTSEDDNGIWYRVVLGPYAEKRQAERDKNMLMRARIEPCGIWFWEDE